MMPYMTAIAKSANPQPGDVYVNPIAPNILISYFQKQGGLQGMFAPVPVDLQSGIIPKISRADTMRAQTTLKAPRAAPSQIGYGTDLTATYFCKVYEGEYVMSPETLANYSLPGSATLAASEFLGRAAYLRMELDWISNYFATSVWGTDVTPTVTWDDPSSDPIGDIETGIETVLKNTGMRPNVLGVGYKVWKALKQHPDILNRIGTGNASNTDPRMITRQLVAALFGLEEIMVGEVAYNSAAEGAAISMDFAAGRNALLCYRTAAPSIVTPSAGYKFTWRGLTGSVDGVQIRNSVEERSQEAWWQVKHAQDFKVVASELGYFFSNCVAA